MTSGTRVLVCEDSATYAAALRRTLEHDGNIAVAAVCTTAEEALAKLPEVDPDLVTMDIELPGMSGLEAVEQIMGTKPRPVLVLSSYTPAGSGLAAAALAAGALDAIAKDDLDLTDPGGVAAAAFRHRIRVLSRARVIRHPRAGLRAGASTAEERTAVAVGICASAGGPQALATILRDLPADFAVPLLVVQHISAGFSDSLTRWLDGIAAVPVRLAVDGARVERGMWLAPEGAHLKLGSDYTLELDRRSAAGPHRPSGDVLLESLAAVARAESVAVVLTGMGRDGAAGAKAVRDAGGLVVVQDEQSSAVWGMPQAAAASGASMQLAPKGIARLLTSLRLGRRTV